MAHRDSSKRSAMVAAAGTVLLLCIPAFGQRAMTTPTQSMGHAGTAPSRPAIAPSRPMTQTGAFAPRPSHVMSPQTGASRPSYGRPGDNGTYRRDPSNNHQHSDRWKDDWRRRRNVGHGLGLPYYPYIGPTAFVNADNNGNFFFNDDDDAAQSEQQGGPARPDYDPQQDQGQYQGPDPGQGPYPGQGPGPYPDDFAGPGNYPAQRPPYNPNATQQPQHNTAANQSDGLDHPEVTLVFNNGRPPKKVRSYVLTNSTVFVLENGHQSQIPVAELDLPATVAQNRDAGVDFTLPGGSQ